MSKRLILMVCTGNVCRSPMAEFMLRDRLGPQTDWDVKSAGLGALPGNEATPEAVQALAEAGIDMSRHRSRFLDREWIDEASLVVVMTRAHVEQVKALRPSVADKIFLLKSFGPDRGGDVEDPIGMSVEFYRETRDDIGRALPELVSFLKSLDLP